jgi:hypothetical protein
MNAIKDSLVVLAVGGATSFVANTTTLIQITMLAFKMIVLCISTLIEMENANKFSVPLDKRSTLGELSASWIVISTITMTECLNLVNKTLAVAVTQSWSMENAQKLAQITHIGMETNVLRKHATTISTWIHLAIASRSHVEQDGLSRLVDWSVSSYAQGTFMPTLSRQNAFKTPVGIMNT